MGRSGEAWLGSVCRGFIMIFDNILGQIPPWQTGIEWLDFHLMAASSDASLNQIWACEWWPRWEWAPNGLNFKSFPQIGQTPEK
jgi:hypothetical protein